MASTMVITTYEVVNGTRLASRMNPGVGFDSPSA